MTAPENLLGCDRHCGEFEGSCDAYATHLASGHGWAANVVAPYRRGIDESVWTILDDLHHGRRDAISEFTGKHGFLSNFHDAVVSVDGVLYDTAEHAFQAAKCVYPHEAHRIRRAPSPGEAKRIGRTVTLRQGWIDDRDDVMHHIIAAKFAHGSLLAERLRGTGTALLIEGNGWGDRYWGVCEGVGENRLGRILTERRVELDREDRT